MSRMIQEAVARSRQKPTLRILRNTVARPRRQCRYERVGQRVFSGRDVARAHCEQRNETSVRFARYRFDLAMGQLVSSSLQR